MLFFNKRMKKLISISSINIFFNDKFLINEKVVKNLEVVIIFINLTLLIIVLK